MLQLKFAFLQPDLTFVPNLPENIDCAELFQCDKEKFRERFFTYYEANNTSELEIELADKMNLHKGEGAAAGDVNIVSWVVQGRKEGWVRS